MNYTPGTKPACSVFRRRFLEIEVDQGARTADSCGYDLLEPRDSLVDGLQQSPNWKKKDCPMARVLCQGKQTNKPQAVLEVEGHVISEREREGPDMTPEASRYRHIAGSLPRQHIQNASGYDGKFESEQSRIG